MIFIYAYIELDVSVGSYVQQWHPVVHNQVPSLYLSTANLRPYLCVNFLML